MGLGLLYWILMILWLVFMFWWHWPLRNGAGPWPGNIFLFVLLVIIGWQIFGAPVRG